MSLPKISQDGSGKGQGAINPSCSSQSGLMGTSEQMSRTPASGGKPGSTAPLKGPTVGSSLITQPSVTSLALSHFPGPLFHLLEAPLSYVLYPLSQSLFLGNLKENSTFLEPVFRCVRWDG